MKVYKALTIAGSDSGGGAGIQADLKTFQELGVYGMSAITAVTAQNTLGVQGVYPLPVDAVTTQMDSIGEDLGVDAVKTGMLFSSEIISAVARKIRHYQWTNLVVDPVMIAKGGATLLEEEALTALVRDLIPLAAIVTPNIPEAATITRMTIENLAQREEAAKAIFQMGAQNVMIKGGHDEQSERVVDLLYDGKQFYYLEGERINTRHTHGTGCTFAAAITAELAKGIPVAEAVKTAKSFIKAAIEDQLGIGSGHGPTNHWAYQNRRRGEMMQ
ncbi:bifunctional hydroxymethylpyrimidine kinase/phosphomethylpyrimidine kinase [Ammoniphilus resinae]|uniref:Hydroxymethylpyrimidine/phosphomethylpyrimidine kinase n=1 Tax=Ammoniphilus resinae TaxID=861532 RepID=A0ABS4GR87_9BACL|nr:bifunctional hydroxymethylpyrimidine kinase/phosphomethylpyrimidine kinase [Ammoniphilus resinae]MBP1932395.1 hydroxymethylpyrimidine/phosphomethylpyrimidine kinase [Ammoniphilus resinae]